MRALGFAAALALLFAGATVHDGLRTAGDVAVVRLSGSAADAVLAEWERMLLDPQLPAEQKGPSFRWHADERIQPLELRERALDEQSVFDTLVAEAGRRELVEGDAQGALDLVLEALNEHPAAARHWIARLRALQLAARLERDELMREQWAQLRDCPLSEASDGIPCRLLAWLALPQELAAEFPPAALISAGELERLFLEGDGLELGPRDAPAPRFELAPLLSLLTQRLGLPEPPLERRMTAALERRVGSLPTVEESGRWQLVELEERLFLVRDEDGLTGFFATQRGVQSKLAARAGLPAGFALDFQGEDDSLGVAVRAPTRLPASPLSFTLRHVDPVSLGREESSRLRLLRGALVVLALACAAGGWVTARVLARERKLAEMRSAFIAGVSHDLRTPLAAILLLTENLESGAVEGAGRERYHRALRKEATRLRRLVDDVLDFSRIERGKGASVEPEDVALPALMAELADEARAHVEGAGRAFEWEQGELPEEACIDARALGRALENLIENALRHGQGLVRLSCKRSGERLLLVVGDDGPGVPPAEHERVFEAFERLSTNGHVGGAGLGLSIVRAVARGHGGEARVRASPAGGGTVFEIELPLKSG